MGQSKSVLVSVELVMELVYYLNSRDDPQAWEFAEVLQGKLDKVFARAAYSRRLEEVRMKAIDQWLEAVDLDIHLDDEDEEKEGL